MASLRACCGLLIVAITLCFKALPYLIGSWHTAISTGLFFGGLLLCAHDVAEWLTEEIRSFLRRNIESVSLDEILQSIYSAESLLIENVVGLVAGQFAMYGMPCSNDQKVRLLQSGLEVVNEEEARCMLLQPGGWRLLLPEAVQNWIFESCDEDQPAITVEEPRTRDSDAKSNPSTSRSNNGISLSEASEIYELEKDRIRGETFDVSSLIGVRIDAERQSETPSTERDSAKRRQEETSNPDDSPQPPLPINVFGSVVKEIVTDAIHQTLSTFSHDKWLEMVGGAISVLLLGQLVLSRRSRQIILGLLTGATTAGLVSAWGVSMASLLAKYSMQQTREAGVSPLSMNPQYLRTILKRIAERCKDAKVQCLIAALVITYWGRRRSQTHR